MGRRILLVEGKDDEHVVRRLCQAHSITIPFGFSDADEGGVEKLLSQVPTRLKESDLECLAIILDADEDLSARWHSLRSRLANAGHENVPNEPSLNGTILVLSDGFRNLRFSVWVMPDNKLPGTLENFLAFLVPVGDPTLELADQFIDSIPPANRKFPEAKRAKARIHSFLAVQKEPGKPLSIAITSKFLNAEAPAAIHFVAWIRDALVN